MKFKKIFRWECVEKALRVIEVIAIVSAACIIFNIPGQIKEWENSQGNRSLDLLLKLEDKMGDGNNEKIFNYIDNNKPILIQNKGTLTEDDMDYYLSNLTSIAWAYENNLISSDDLYTWFSEYLIKTCENKEVQTYLLKIRKIDPAYYMGIDSAYSDVKQYKASN